MGNWWTIVPALVAASAVVFIPGGVVLRLLRVRGIALAALAPIVSTAIIGLSAIVLAMLEVRWTVLSFALCLVAIALLAWALRRFTTTSVTPEPTPRRWLLVFAVSLGVLFGLWRVIAYVQQPDAISQTNDAVFHMSAVRFILESGSASSFTVANVVGASSFYPSAWHAIVSLVVLLSGAEIALAANATTLAICALIWTAGLTWLAQVTFKRVLVTAVTAVIAGAMQAFPLLMFQWGVLFPNGLSTALLPGALALVISLPEWLKGKIGWRRGWPAVMLATLSVLVTIAGIALAQPAGLLPFGLMSLIWLTFWLLVSATGTRWLRLLVLAAAWAAFAIIWWRLARSTSGSHWGAFRGKAESALDVVLNAQMHIPPALVISVLMIVGLIGALRSRQLWWIIAAWGANSVLYMFVASVGNQDLRSLVMGAWYADPYRIASLAPILVLPLAAYGAVIVADIVVPLLHRRPVEAVKDHGAWTWWIVLGTFTVGMLLLVSFRSTAVPHFSGTYDSGSRYTISDTSYLSTDELAVLEELDEVLPADARVIVNPSTGGGFGYFVTGLDVYPRTWSPPAGEDWLLLADSLRDASSDPRVCKALATFEDPTYVLDFGLGSRGGGKYEMPGMTDFVGQPGFEEVLTVGDASLWRITACGH